jgi:hypothetical protein
VVVVGLVDVKSVSREFLKVCLAKSLVFLMLEFGKVEILLNLFLGLYSRAWALLVNQPVVLVEHLIEDVRMVRFIF